MLSETEKNYSEEVGEASHRVAGGCGILNRNARGTLIEKATLQQTDIFEGTSHMDFWGKNFQQREEQCKDLYFHFLLAIRMT